VPAEKRGQFVYGDVWTWTALCADTKLVPSWYVGTRDAEAAKHFMTDLASRLELLSNVVDQPVMIRRLP
jgi:transposase-like protein